MAKFTAGDTILCLAADCALPLLLKQMACLEDRSQDFPKAADPRIHAPDMVEHVTEIRPHLRVERGKLQVRQPIADLGHRFEHTLEADQLTAKGEQPPHFVPLKKCIEQVLLSLEHLLFDRLNDRQIPIDDEIENGMEHIVDPVAEQRGRRFELMAQLGMCAARTVAHGNDVILADEDRGLAVGDLVVLQMRGACHHEQLVSKDVYLGQLMRFQRILDRQRMEPIIFLKLPQLSFGRLEQPNPDELGSVRSALIRLVERNRASPFPIAIEIGGDNAHSDPVECFHGAKA